MVAVTVVLCFQSAKLSKAFDFNKESMRARQVIEKFWTSLSATVMFLENSSRNEKKSSAPKF